MEFKFKKIKWNIDSEGFWISILAPEKVKEFTNQIKDKEYDCILKEHREKRSLDANAYAWLLIGKIADTLRASKDEIYLQMLKIYGQSVVVSVLEIATDQFKKSVKYCEDFGEAELNGKKFKHIKVFIGSSEYDTNQFAIFLDGIISEAKELGIDTMTPDEIAKLKASWK